MALVTAKTLFVHVPKTGGTSVRAMLRAAGVAARESGPFEVEDHYGLPELRAAHPQIDNGLLTFGFVRHPVAWLKSRWAWGVVTNMGEKVHYVPAAAAHWMAGCWSDRFEEFAARYLERYAGVYTQTAFAMLGVWTDRPAMRIGHTESLSADLASILDEAGEQFDAGAFKTVAQEKKAASGDLAAKCEISAAMQARIAAAEPLLCERFGY